MPATDSTEFRVSRDDLHATEVAHRALEPAEGQALFRVDRFALTANNVTYAAHGDDMAYWRFFPAPDGWGIVPVWGFATVVESRVHGLAEGDRVWGYWPMASHALLTPTRVTPRGFTDDSGTRAGLAAVYNSYQRVEESSAHDEALTALFRPLYATSFLLDDMLADADWFGARTILLTSASSKTSIGLAQAITARPDHPEHPARPEVVGLTSPRNRAFVESTAVYDRILTYDEIETLDPAARAVLIDFAGDAALRRRTHTRYGDALASSQMIGHTRWDAAMAGGEAPLPGPTPTLFFAPDQMAKRIAEWGPGGFEQRFGTAWGAFIVSTAGWLRVVDSTGVKAAEHHYRRFLDGGADPAEGVILSMRT